MHWTQQLIRTEKPETGRPIMQRAGLTRPTHTGQSIWLPMGWRIITRLHDTIQRHFQALNPIACHLTDQPGELPDAITALFQSYKQLPAQLGQTNLPGSMDLWCLCTDSTQAAQCREQLANILSQLWRELKLSPARIVTIDGSAEVFPQEDGAFHYAASDKNDYATALSAVPLPGRPFAFGIDPKHELQNVETPDAHSVEQVSQLLDVPPTKILKTLVFRAVYPPQSDGPPLANMTNPRWVVAVVRGDHSLNLHKLHAVLKDIFHIDKISSTITQEMQKSWAIGFVGPDAATRIPDAIMVIDPDATNEDDWVAGANRPNYHVRHFNWFREAGQQLADPAKVAVADIRNAVQGDPSPLNNDGHLILHRGAALAQIRCTELAGTFTDATGQRQPLHIAGVSLNLESILHAIAAIHADEKGIAWPIAIAPASIIITPIPYEADTRRLADQLHDQLSAAGIAVLLDDRIGPRAGEKFADADLLGIPLRLTIGQNSLKNSTVELKTRRADEPSITPINQVVNKVKQLLQERET